MSTSNFNPVFRDEHDDPVRFYIHQSVTESKREKVIDAIEQHGGEVAATDKGVDTVIVDPSYRDAYELQIAYHVHVDKRLRNIRVEDTKFVFNCIKAAGFKHAPLKRYPMRGNYPGRTNFTDKDDENLCHYLAIRVPNPESGGRLGHRIYEELVELARVMPETYAWAARHPPGGWRQRYRSEPNRTRLDAMIRRFVLREKPTEEQLYPFDRRLNRSFPPLSPVEDDPEGDEEDEHPTYHERWQNRNKRVAASRRRLREKQRALREEEEESGNEESAPESEDSEDPNHRPSVDLEPNAGPETAIVPAQLPDTTYSSPNRSRRRAANEPDASQVTLIGPGTGTQYESPTRSLRGRRSRPKATALPPSSDDDIDDEVESQTGPPDPTAVEHRAESPQRTMPPIVLAPVQGSPRRSRRLAEADPPYRNTRARSRSVNLPPAQDLATVRQVKRRRKKAFAGPPLSPPIEQQEEPAMEVAEDESGIALNTRRAKRQKRGWVEESTMGHQQEVVPVPETINEEADVERLLTTETNVSAQQEHWPLPTTSRSGTRRRQRLVDTDDEQIDRKLNAQDFTPSHPDPLPDPIDLLKEFNKSSSKSYRTPTPVSSTARAVQPLFLSKIKQEAADDTDWRSASTEASFPFPGTRASDIKRKIEEERKREEYVPPSTTRAARYAQHPR